MRLRFSGRIKPAYAAALGVVAGLCMAGAYELATSRLQARVLAGFARDVRFWTEPGPSPAIRFTKTGPYDHRLGYADLPQFIERLTRFDYAVVEQARISPALMTAMDRGLFAPYREKAQAGLTLQDCRGDVVYAERYPESAYPSFEAIPRLLVDSLLFIENRELFEGESPTRNPAVEWDRFARAVAERLFGVFWPANHNGGGGSTLATQIEKYRHSPHGITHSPGEKLRQMASASLRSYLDGEDTFAARRRIVLDYINTVPLAARPGVGEVAGLPDGLRVWFGRDYRQLDALLSRDIGVRLEDRALAYKQALALMVAQRRPSHYLLEDMAALDAHTNAYLRRLAAAGVIPETLKDAALAQRLEPGRDTTQPASPSFASRKAAYSTRLHVAALLGRPLLYDLDRLDLTVEATLDLEIQRSITAVLASLQQPDVARAFGLIAPRMLAEGDPTKVTYSFTLYERAGGANVVRVQADNLDQPLDVNENTKLDLGSTAKLRTLVTYLEIVAGLHQRYHALAPEELRKLPRTREDPISAWALDYLAQTRDRDLEAMLEAALDRRYSASPHEGFFTGGGLHYFENFEPEDNARVLTVREALRRSVNLVFIRLMRDMVHHFMFNLPDSSTSFLEDAQDPVRQEYLTRFADREGAEYLRRFYRKYHGQGTQQTLELLAQEIRPTPRRLAVIFRSVQPEAGLVPFAEFLQRHLPKGQQPSMEEMVELYMDYERSRYSLADRGYLSRVHPLLLWLVEYLEQHPKASLTEVLEASRDERLAVYGWLFKSRHKSAQDRRIRTLLEVDAFREIHRGWQRLGYPFDSLVPSYATALGASGDRPAALAELMGVLVNDGMRLPTVRIRSLHFAAGTPYETRMEYQPPGAQRVLPQEVARVARRALANVVEDGTARRLKGAFVGANGEPLAVGGKTGTGDHRFQTFDRYGRSTSSKVVGRAGTFVFHIGDRYFGVITAYVRGPDAGSYKFTSGLTVQILKMLAPVLSPLTGQIGTLGPGRCDSPGRNPIMAAAR